MKKLDKNFFMKDVLDLAPLLIGKVIVRTMDDGRIIKARITETEAYRGCDDKACHAHKGRTKRTDVMYCEGGRIYVYLIYGMHWLFNIVCYKKDEPQAVLIRAVEDYNGPGKLTKALKIDKSFNYEKIYKSNRIYIADDNYNASIITDKRVGIDYAGEYWANKKWRFIDKGSR